LRLQRDSPFAYFYTGIAYHSTKKLKDAIEAYKQAIKLNPNFAEAHFNLALVYRDAGKTTEALNEYRILQQLNPNLANQYLLIATEKK
jgi:tetratricopeptide (TPR) repeat protein